MERFSLCPGCTSCPEVVIDGDTVQIGEDENTVVLQKAEWNVLVDAISHRSAIGPAGPGRRRRAQAGDVDIGPSPSTPASDHRNTRTAAGAAPGRRGDVGNVDVGPSH